MSSSLRNPRLQLMLVIGLITASSFWVWWFTRYQPKMEEIQSLAEQENRLLLSNQQARRTVAALGLERIQQSIDAYDRQAEYVAQLVPPDTVPFDALGIIGEKAREFGVRVSGVQPQPDDTSGGFLVRKYQVRVIGEYHDVAAFMTELLSLPRITRISEGQLRQIQQPPSVAGGAPNYQVESVFTLGVYSTRTAMAATTAEQQPSTSSARSTQTQPRRPTRTSSR